MHNIEPEEVKPEESAHEEKEESVTTVITSGDATQRDLRAKTPGFGINNSRPEIKENKGDSWKAFFWTVIIALAGFFLLFFLYKVLLEGDKEDRRISSNMTSSSQSIIRLNSSLAGSLSQAAPPPANQPSLIRKVKDFPAFPLVLENSLTAQHILFPFYLNSVAEVTEEPSRNQRIFMLKNDIRNLAGDHDRSRLDPGSLLEELRKITVRAFKRMRNGVLDPAPQWTDIDLDRFIRLVFRRARLSTLQAERIPVFSFAGDNRRLIAFKAGHVHSRLDSLLKCVSLAICGQLDTELLLINRLVLSMALVLGQKYFHDKFCESPECAREIGEEYGPNERRFCLQVKGALKQLLKIPENEAHLRYNNVAHECENDVCLKEEETAFLSNFLTQDVYLHLLSIVYDRLIVVSFLTDPVNKLSVRTVKRYFPANSRECWGRMLRGDRQDERTNNVSKNAWNLCLSGERFSAYRSCPPQHQSNARTNDPSVLD